MFTVCIVFYVLISLYCSVSNMFKRRSADGSRIEPMKPKEAFKQGFLALPISFALAIYVMLMVFIPVGLTFSLLFVGLWACDLLLG